MVIKKTKIRKQRILLGFFLVLILIVMYFSSGSEVENLLRCEKRINILMLGCDELKYSKHADVIMLLSYEPRTKFLDILSIPRDSKVPRTDSKHWRPYQKANEVYARAYNKTKNPHDSCIAVKDSISKFLDMTIQFYLQVDYNSFCDVIDAMGGVEMNIEKRMDYDDNWGKLHIHFKPGLQKLNGKKSLEYIRFRDKALGDVGRIVRQHKFLKILSNQMRNVRLLMKLPDIYSAIVRNTWTNMWLKDVISLMIELRDVTRRDLRIQNLPGIAKCLIGKNYWVTEKEKVGNVVQVIKNSYRENSRNYGLKPMAETFDDIVVVEVWNATSRRGLAEDLQLYLRQFGIDAVRWGNYGNYKKYTTVIDRQGDIGLAYRVARVVGCSEVKTEIDKTRLVELSIVIGDDFKEIYEKKY